MSLISGILGVTSKLAKVTRSLQHFMI